MQSYTSYVHRQPVFWWLRGIIIVLRFVFCRAVLGVEFWYLVVTFPVGSSHYGTSRDFLYGTQPPRALSGREIAPRGLTFYFFCSGTGQRWNSWHGNQRATVRGFTDVLDGNRPTRYFTRRESAIQRYNIHVCLFALCTFAHGVRISHRDISCVCLYFVLWHLRCLIVTGT